MDSTTPVAFLPIFIMFLIALAFAVFILYITHRTGPHRKTKVKLETFECGIETKGNARVPFSIKYFLVAILFVLFDIEVIFMYPWAANFKELKMTGIIEMFSFIILLLVGFYYMIAKKALKWED
ncbi:MAG: NADH-quinone oxidoreductase subunit A [Bacteroidia bacterium]|nr:NADH-quinone oxidoreductase subunit A [Bacteroidia bacterium]